MKKKLFDRSNKQNRKTTAPQKKYKHTSVKHENSEKSAFNSYLQLLPFSFQLAANVICITFITVW
jgi:hypothetical protein